MLKNTSHTYGSMSKSLHWIIAILLIGMLIFGYYLEDIPKEYKGLLYNVHKLTGITILTLMVLRLCWALCNPKPALPAGTPWWEHVAEHLVHFSLYFFVILMPLAGWIGSSAVAKFPHIGDFKFALPVPESKAIAGTAFDVHEVVAVVLIVLISVHVLAALYHYFVKKDGILQRML